MKLARPRGNDVKVTIQPHPYVKGQKGVNKSVIVYEASTAEVFQFIKDAFAAALGEDAEDYEGDEAEEADGEDDE